jgi:hypothetical protein
MNLSFLSPLAFQLLYALPLLVVPYLLRKQEKEVIVPAIFLYQGLPSSSRRKLWGRIQLTPLFFLQLLILLLLITAAARPFLHQPGGKVALVLDTSASMQARAPNGVGSIFDLAKQQAAQALDTIPASDHVNLFVNTPLPTPLSSPTDERGTVRTLLSASTVTDAPEPTDEVLSAFFSQLLGEQGFQRIFFFTDRPLTEPVNTKAVEVITLGGIRANVGITSFRLYRSPFAPEEIDATATVTGVDTVNNFTLNIEDADSGQRLASRSFTKGDASDCSFSRLPVTKAYRARLQVEDGLALDNEAYAVLPSLHGISVLLVTPAPNVARSLGAIPNLKVERLTPQEYTPAKAAGFAFVLFHLTAPAALPPTNAAFFLPPEGNPLFPLGKAAHHVQVTQWTAAHPLTSYVTFSLFSPVYAQALQPGGWRQTVIHATVGPIVQAGEQEGKRYVVTGFDVLPYLGKQNLPMSIFTLNLLGWLADQAGQPPSLKTGAQFTLTGEPASARAPNGEILLATTGTLSLRAQGLYTISEYGVERRVAVNLASEQESTLARPLHLTALTPPAPVAPETTGQPVWPWLLLGALVLLTLDRWLATRTRVVPQTR